MLVNCSSEDVKNVALLQQRRGQIEGQVSISSVLYPLDKREHLTVAVRGSPIARDEKIRPGIEL